MCLTNITFSLSDTTSLSLKKSVFQFGNSVYPGSQTVTGDTIVSSKATAVAAAQRAKKEGGGERKQGGGGEQGSLVLAGVEVPEPVFFCSIEPPTMAKQAGECPWNSPPLSLWLCPL